MKIKHILLASLLSFSAISFSHKIYAQTATTQSEINSQPLHKKLTPHEQLLLNHKLLSAVTKEHPNMAIIKKLVAEGADINAYDDLYLTTAKITVLMYAVSCTYYVPCIETPDLVAYLIAHGVNINATDPDRNTALDYALNTPHHLAVIKLLEKAGGKAHNELNYHLIKEASVPSPNMTTIKKLITEGASVNAHNSDYIQGNRKTVLMVAAQYNQQPDLITYLLENGAKVNTIDDDGNTALDYALACTPYRHEKTFNDCLNNNTSPVIKAIQKAGGKEGENEDNPNSLNAALDSAVENPYPNIVTVKKLIAEGANVNAHNSIQIQGNTTTILMDAAGSNETPNIITYLIAHGANVNIMDDYGNTALYYAEDCMNYYDDNNKTAYKECRNDNSPAINAIEKAGGKEGPHSAFLVPSS